MSIELIIAIVLVAALAVVLASNHKKGVKSADVNADGKVDLNDVKAALDNTTAVVKEAADINKDGKVDAEDAKVVVEKAKAGAKKAATKAKAAVKRSTAKKSTT